MSLTVNMQGGTGGGRLMHRRTEPHPDWRCNHGHDNKGRALVCMTAGCREKRRHT